MFVDMPPHPPAEFRYECPEVVKFWGDTGGRFERYPGQGHYYGRLDGGYSVERITAHGGHVIYTITRACAGA